MKNFIRDIGYTGIGDKKTKGETVFTKTVPKLVEEIQKKLLMKLQTILMIYKDME